MPDTSPRPDVVVLGTGITGSFVAHHLAALGLRVLVADRGGLAPGTSRSSDGNLLMSDKDPGPLFAFGARSLALWEAFIAEAGNACEYDPKGATLVTRDAAQVAPLAAHVAAHAGRGVRASVLSPDEWREVEPGLAPDVAGVGWWPDDAQVQPMLACYQIAKALKARGVAYRLYEEVASLTASPGGVEVAFASGTRVAADRIVVCAGVWTNAVLAPLGLALPIKPRKGQLAVLERGDVEVRTKVADFAYNTTVHGADPGEGAVQTAAIIEATRSGTILCGSSRQFAGFDTGADEAVLGRMLRDCLALVPGLGRLRVIRGYAGLRPYAADGLPLVGAVDEGGRVLVATGHEGAGHGLAPATGELVAALIAGTPSPFAPAFDPRRFG